MLQWMCFMWNFEALLVSLKCAWIVLQSCMSIANDEVAQLWLRYLWIGSFGKELYRWILHRWGCAFCVDDNFGLICGLHECDICVVDVSNRADKSIWFWITQYNRCSTRHSKTWDLSISSDFLLMSWCR